MTQTTAALCPHCDYPNGEEEVLCAKCLMINPLDTDFCQRCEHDLYAKRCVNCGEPTVENNMEKPT